MVLHSLIEEKKDDSDDEDNDPFSAPGDGRLGFEIYQGRDRSSANKFELRPHYYMEKSRTHNFRGSFLDSSQTGVRLYLPKALCLLSRYPFYDYFKEIL